MSADAARKSAGATCDNPSRLYPLEICVLLVSALLGEPLQLEVSTRDVPPTFIARSNLVLVRVVVRDRQGKPVGALRKDDFQLFDRGKPQNISRFSMEKTELLNGPSTALADRYVAYVFDDLHLSAGDLAAARNAAERLSSRPAAIYTTSGQTMLDFTNDAARLRDTLDRIQPRSKMSATGTECPDLSYYWADLIQNKHDPQALQAAVQETILCARLDPQTMQNIAQSMAQAAASRVISLGETEARLSLKLLRDVVRRTATMPGQRNVVVVSPGFLVLENRSDELDIIDRAIRANVTIGGLDARGLFALVPGGDVSVANAGDSNPANLLSRSQYQKAGALADADVMAELADATGGTFFHNSNDLEEGFRRLAAVPEYYYVLGFTPSNLKNDGSYHNLKVSLVKDSGLNLQARRGYFAPKHEMNAAEEATREVEEALFSRNEWHDLLVNLATQFFKSTDVNAKLSVLARIDVRQLHFRKEDGRNVDSLTVVSGVFDRNGNTVGAVEKTVDLHLKDATLARRMDSGITVKSVFDVTPGSYFVRIVVRDSEGQKMAAVNSTVEIP